MDNIKCPHCNEEIELSVLFPDIAPDITPMWLGERLATADFYEFVKLTLDAQGSCYFMCSGDYRWLKNKAEGRKRLRAEGYEKYPSGCDDVWEKKRD